MIDQHRNMSDAQIRNLLASSGITIGGTSEAPPVEGYKIQIADTWTTDGAGGYYWDLVHGLGRKILPVTIYDNKTNEYIFRIKSMKPLAGSETTTLRITMTYEPEDDRLEIGYL